MRWPDGYTPNDLALIESLRSPTDRTVAARLLSADYQLLGEVDLLEGQVDGDVTDLVRTKASLTVLDGDGLLEGPSMNLQVQLIETRTAEGLSRPAVWPLFTGFITAPPARQMRELTLTCQDRAVVPMRGRPKKSYPRGNAVDVIRQILADCGETRFRFPKMSARTDDPVVVGRDEENLPLVQATKVADSLDMDLFPDAEGYWVLRDYPESPVLDLSELVEMETATTPPGEISNKVIVRGKGRLTASRTLGDLDQGHPLAPGNIKVGGVPQELGTIQEENDKLKTQSQVNARADRLMQQARARLDETRGYQVAPVPGMELHDPFRVGSVVTPLRAFSYPLLEGAATVGYRVPLPRGSRRGR